jgi:hypothetical protein
VKNKILYFLSFIWLLMMPILFGGGPLWVFVYCILERKYGESFSYSITLLGFFVYSILWFIINEKIKQNDWYCL